MSIDELRPEYKRSDIGELDRGKYATRVADGTNIVLLEPDVAEAFPNDKGVNEAHRGLLEIASCSPNRSFPNHLLFKQFSVAAK